MNDSQIRQRLRDGDPLTYEAGLTPDEIHAMRRTVLTAVPEGRRRLLPALAWAGAAASLLIAVISGVALRPGAAPSPQPSRIAAAPAPAPTIAEPESPAAILREETPLPAAPEQPRPRHHRHRPSERTPSTSIALAALKPADFRDETAIREIQFSTPGGTRIIWTLAPGKTLR